MYAWKISYHNITSCTIYYLYNISYLNESPFIMAKLSARTMANQPNEKFDIFIIVLQV